MALRYLRGRMDLSKLSHADLADAAAALTTLERLAKDGVIEFEARGFNTPPRLPVISHKRPTELPRLQQDILKVLAEGPLNWQGIQTATGMKEGSLSAHLTHLVRARLIIKETSI